MNLSSCSFVPPRDFVTTSDLTFLGGSEEEAVGDESDCLGQRRLQVPQQPLAVLSRLVIGILLPRGIQPLEMRRGGFFVHFASDVDPTVVGIVAQDVDAEHVGRFPEPSQDYSLDGFGRKWSRLLLFLGRLVGCGGWHGGSCGLRLWDLLGGSTIYNWS